VFLGRIRVWASRAWKFLLRLGRPNQHLAEPKLDRVWLAILVEARRTAAFARPLGMDNAFDYRCRDLQ
jgi:hypothetical protein